MNLEAFTAFEIPSGRKKFVARVHYFSAGGHIFRRVVYQVQNIVSGTGMAPFR